MIMGKPRKRRGMTLVEAITSIVLLILVTAIFMGLINVVRSNMRSTAVCIELKIYAMEKINQIQLDLENGLEIDEVNYSDSGEETGIFANVYITEVGEIYDKPLFRVEISASHVRTGETVKTQTILRKGCIANAR